MNEEAKKLDLQKMCQMRAPDLSLFENVLNNVEDSYYMEFCKDLLVTAAFYVRNGIIIQKLIDKGSPVNYTQLPNNLVHS